MAWVQLGSRKINTTVICYMDQGDETLNVHFQGSGNTLELSGEEARALWKHLKAEDAMTVRDKGSAMVLPKRWTAMPETPANNAAAKPAAAAPAAAPAAPAQPKPASSGHSSSSHSSSSHRSSSSPSHHASHSHGHKSSHQDAAKSSDGHKVIGFKKE